MKGSNKRGKYVVLVAFMFSTFTAISTYEHIYDQDSLEYYFQLKQL